MVTAWDYNPGKDGDDKTGKTGSLMQLVRGMDWEASELMQPTRVRLLECPMRFKNSDLRSKRTTVQFKYKSRRATTTKTRTRNATNTNSPCGRNESDY